MAYPLHLLIINSDGNTYFVLDSGILQEWHDHVDPTKPRAIVVAS